jgi:hypothetical protein
MTIKGWRERADLAESYEVYGPSPVERAMLEEIAELRAAVEVYLPPGDSSLADDA